jgi:signal transduction histidine kinase/CheY-like chemotaxis protein
VNSGRIAQRALIFAPRGRDAVVAKGLLRDAHIHADICVDFAELIEEMGRASDVTVVTEEALHGVDTRPLGAWVSEQAPWSDYPFIVLTEHGGGLERNPAAALLTQLLGNVTFLERPFHPTTLVSVVQTALRGRRRQYDVKELADELESRVQQRTAELAATNRQLLAQIDERERIETTLRRMQRLEAVGQLTSGVAHDFNNLLTVVLGNIGFLEKGLTKAGLDSKLVQRLGYMRSAAERGAKLTDQLLSFSRRQRLEPKAVDLNETVTAMRDLLQSTMGGSIRIDIKLGGTLSLALADPTQVELAILNLAINARDAMHIGGSLTVATANVRLTSPINPEDPPPGEYVEICVSDTGSGMPPEVVSKAFEPFFTTKEIGKGSGLGLSQVLGFAKQSGGGVRIFSEPGRGTSVHIYLPRAEAVDLPQSPREASTRIVERRSANILLVDDDGAVREVTAAILRELGYEVMEAGSGGAALELLDREEGKIDMIIIDLAMPGMSGADVARLVQAKRPGLPTLFVTGFADRAALKGVSDAQVVGKPFINSELAEKVRTTLFASRSRKVVPLRR